MRNRLLGCPRSAGGFVAWLATDADCLDYVEWLRWPEGFVCLACGHRVGWRMADGLIRCGAWDRRMSVTAGTILDKTCTQLTVWFMACWLQRICNDSRASLLVEQGEQWAELKAVHVSGTAEIAQRRRCRRAPLAATPRRSSLSYGSCQPVGC